MAKLERNIIFYFSGTGNSLKAAKDIASALGDCEVVPMTKAYVFAHSYERIGFVFPCYAQGLPHVVAAFIESLYLSINQDAYYFTVPTCGGNPGNCIAQVNELLEEKGHSLSFGAIVKMFSNYIPLYKMADNPQEKADESNKAIAIIAKQVVEKEKSKIPKTNIFLKQIYKRMVSGYKDKAEHYRVSEACDGCGKCEQVCPVKNIYIRDGKPIFEGRCEQCMACIQWCPNLAINYKNKTQKSGRYHHPEISFEEMAIS